MTTETKQTTEIIKTKYWELPVETLDGWRPYSAFLDYRLLDEGPDIGPREQGFSLYKNQMVSINGHRGAGKTTFDSFLTAKKMRNGVEAFTNCPISFYVIEADGSLTYYESHPLDLDKFVSFTAGYRKIVATITEMQYYVEARTSGRLQNRMAGYKIMQIRKEASDFFYDVQDQSWVDKRFGWSDDVNITCRDVSRMPYLGESVKGFPAGMLDQYGNLKEGAVSLLSIKDISGVLTGAPYKETGMVYDNIQFDSWFFWDIFPTHFLIDAWEAYNSLKTPQDEKNQEKEAYLNALNGAIAEFLEAGDLKIDAKKLWSLTKEKLGKDVNTYRAGRILKDAGVTKKPDGYGNYIYDLSVFLPGAKIIEETGEQNE
jgi:hypothetical protein